MALLSEWSARLTVSVGQQVRRYRKRGRISAQELADRTADLGHEIQRSIIANLESGRRVNMPLSDVLVLAQALRVPVSMLVYPLGTDESCEVLPEVYAATDEAVRWVDGDRGPLLATDDQQALVIERMTYHEAQMYRQHRRLLVELEVARADLGDADVPTLHIPDPRMADTTRTSSLPFGEWQRERVALLRRQLEALRADMARSGLALPVDEDAQAHG